MIQDDNLRSLVVPARFFSESSFSFLPDPPPIMSRGSGAPSDLDYLNLVHKLKCLSDSTPPLSASSPSWQRASYRGFHDAGHTSDIWRTYIYISLTLSYGPYFSDFRIAFVHTYDNYVTSRWTASVGGSMRKCTVYHCWIRYI